MFRKTIGSRTWLIAVVMFATTFPVVTFAEGEGPIPQGSMTTTPPNIVLILTDDQRADTLRFMPNVQRLLVRNGISFTNGYVVNPVCCPSRASILTGDYSHTTMVYTNHPGRPFGGFPAFDDDSTIGTWLHNDGYHTGLFGKYLNGYGNQYVPPEAAPTSTTRPSQTASKSTTVRMRRTTAPWCCNAKPSPSSEAPTPRSHSS
jgi:hypothetical protein